MYKRYPIGMFKSAISIWLFGALLILLGCSHPENNQERTKHTAQGTQWHSLPSDRQASVIKTDTSRLVAGQPSKKEQASESATSKSRVRSDARKPKKPQAYDQQTIEQRIESVRRLKASEQQLDLPSYDQSLRRQKKQGRLDDYLFLKNLNTYFTINFDNDIFANRDWYYTNGIRFDFVHPSLGWSGMSKLMVPYRGKSSNYYGLSLVHRMYTPKDPHTGSPQEGDRPFSSYLYLGYFKISNALTNRYRQLSALNLGIIGSAAMAKPIMELIHFAEMPGWDYQVTNDLILDYHFRLEKDIIHGKYFESGGLLDVNAGTLYDKIGIGPYVIAGMYDPATTEWVAEDTWGQTNPTNTSIQAFIYYRFKATLVGYDATLQGGVFRDNDYALSADQINRFTYENRLGISISYRWMAFHAEYYWLSPEYQGCVPHRWMRWNLTFTL